MYRTRRTEPVGNRNPNALGLYDMSGNVWEWGEDCEHETYYEAPKDGSAWLETGGGDCERRMLRGGSWNDLPEDLRASNRNWSSADYRIHNIGFRLAQDLD